MLWTIEAEEEAGLQGRTQPSKAVAYEGARGGERLWGVSEEFVLLVHGLQRGSPSGSLPKLKWGSRTDTWHSRGAAGLESSTS